MNLNEYYIKIKGIKIPVSEEIYKAYKRPVWREKKRRIIRTEREISYDFMTEIGREPEDKTQERIDKIVVDKLFSEIISKKLYRALDELDEDEKLLIDEIYFKNKSERKISDIFAIPRKTIAYRKAKILEKLKEIIENL